MKEDFSSGDLRVVLFTDDSELRISRDSIGGKIISTFSYFDPKEEPVYRMTKEGDFLNQGWQEAINEMAAAGDSAMLSEEQQWLGQVFLNGTFDYQYFMKHGGAQAGDKLTALALAFRHEPIENPDIVTGLLDLFLVDLFDFSRDYGDKHEGVTTQEYLALMRSFTQLWKQGLISDAMVAQFQRVDEFKEELAVQIETLDRENPIRDVLVGFQQQLEGYVQRVRVEEERLRLRAEEAAASLMPLSDEMAVVVTWFEDVEKEGMAFIEAVKASGDRVFEDASWVKRWDTLAQTAQSAAQMLDSVDDLDDLNRREQNLISEWLVTRALHGLVVNCQRRIEASFEKGGERASIQFMRADAAA
ncbi:MAG TPA: hypothetical protein VLJ10_04260, partial [Candidatus Bathyarchaeia archaeon]|nr:hypothetical protein [Candidatus Bathyarchaeia archaeon]